jgi:anthranilate phosphoribosyltransferase
MSRDERAGDLKEALQAIASGRSLDAAEAEIAFDTFMSGAASEAQMAGVLVGLNAKGIRPSEVAGGVRALRKAMLPVASIDPDLLIDTAGTGGGSVTTFNISTVRIGSPLGNFKELEKK